MSNRFGHSGRKCPGCPQWKQTTGVVLMVFAGFEMLGGEGFEGVVMDGAKRESAGGGFATLPGGQLNILPLTVEVSEREVIQEEARNALLAM